MGKSYCCQDPKYQSTTDSIHRSTFGHLLNGFHKPCSKGRYTEQMRRNKRNLSNVEDAVQKEMDSRVKTILKHVVLVGDWTKYH